MKYTLLLVLLLLSGCDEVFVPDPVELRISKYTEDGNQVAGAIVNGYSWKTIFNCSTFGGCDAPPIRIFAFPDADSLVITFIGSYQDGEENGKHLDLQFILKGNAINDFWDLRHLNEQKFVINNTDTWANIGRFDTFLDEDIPLASCDRGQILFRKVEHTLSKNQGSSPGFILAGTFGMECEQNGTLITIYKGRFDFSLERSEVFF